MASKVTVKNTMIKAAKKLFSFVTSVAGAFLLFSNILHSPCTLLTSEVVPDTPTLTTLLYLSNQQFSSIETIRLHNKLLTLHSSSPATQRETEQKGGVKKTVARWECLCVTTILTVNWKTPPNST